MSDRPYPRIRFSSIGYLAAAGITFLLLVICAFGSFYQVDQGDRGAVLRNGKLSSVAEPGLGFKIPVIESARHISVRDQVRAMKLEAYSSGPLRETPSLRAVRTGRFCRTGGA